MNDRRKCYCVYRYRNDSQRQICHVSAVNTDEAEKLLESGRVPAVSHWDFDKDDFGEPELLKDGLFENEAHHWAQYFDDEFRKNRPIGFVGYEPIEINKD